jgi:hypothetical protein
LGKYGGCLLALEISKWGKINASLEGKTICRASGINSKFTSFLSFYPSKIFVSAFAALILFMFSVSTLTECDEIYIPLRIQHRPSPEQVSLLLCNCCYPAHSPKLNVLNQVFVMFPEELYPLLLHVTSITQEEILVLLSTGQRIVKQQHQQHQFLYHVYDLFLCLHVYSDHVHHYQAEAFSTKVSIGCPGHVQYREEAGRAHTIQNSTKK